MIGPALLLFALGLGLSAFFSGAETGLYRATRLRLVLDALGGNRVARGLFWLANRPALFVATMLIGNNLGHYLVSLAVVIGAEPRAAARGYPWELTLPLLLAPVLFVFGELVPKNLFLAAPNRLLRRVGPAVLGFAVLFAPLSVVLWGCNKLLERLLRHSPEQVRATLARRQLRRILEEGHEAGILRPVQRAMAQGIFTIGTAAGEPLRHAPGPISRARSSMSKPDVLGLAQRYRMCVVPVERSPEDRQLAGYVRVAELAISEGSEAGPVHPLLSISDKTTHLTALVRMQTAKEDLAAVLDAQGQTIGLVTAEQLRTLLLQGAAPAGAPLALGSLVAQRLDHREHLFVSDEAPAVTQLVAVDGQGELVGLG